MSDGNLKVPCSRYGHNTGSCVPVALAVARIIEEETGDQTTTDTLDWIMGLVVNDHQDPEDLILDYGTQQDRDLLDYLPDPDDTDDNTDEENTQ